MLARRNERSLAIRGSLGEDVVPVSTEAIDSVPRFLDFSRRRPIGSTIVTFSAPIT